MKYNLKSFIRRALKKTATASDSDTPLFDETAWAKLQRDLDRAFERVGA